MEALGISVRFSFYLLLKTEVKILTFKLLSVFGSMKILLFWPSKSCLMTFRWQLHNIAVGNVGNVYQKDIFYFPELPEDLGTISCFTDTHSSCWLHWDLQITFSSQSYYENLTYILHPPKESKKFQLSPVSSPVRKGRICLIGSQGDNMKAKEITQ